MMAIKKRTVIDKFKYYPKKTGYILIALIALLIAVPFITKITKTQVPPPEDDLFNYRYVYSFAVLKNPPIVAHMIAEEITGQCIENSLPVKMVTHLIWQESHFNIKAIGYDQDPETKKWKPNDFGLFQIRMEANLPTIMACSNAFPKFNLRTYWGRVAALHDLKFNAYLGTRILKKRIQDNNGNIRQALTAYNAGPNSRALEHIRKYGIGNKYELRIVNENAILDEVKLHHKWELKQVKPRRNLFLVD